MILWYKSKELSIYFDDVPCVAIRYIIPSSTHMEIASIKRYPFMNKRDLEVMLKDNKKEKVYKFIIPKGYCYDGASIPRVFWRLVGAPTDNSFLIPALIHDYMCENHQIVSNDRNFSTKVFNALLETSKIGKFKRFMMKNSVGIFQRLCCKW